MKYTSTKLNELSTDNYCRLDEKFYIMHNEKQWKLLKSSNNKYIKLKHILTQDNKNFIYEEDEEYYAVPTGASYINNNGQIINYDIVTKENHPGRIKYKIDNENIIISSLRLAKSPATIFENIDVNKYIFSNGFYILKTNKGWNNKFIMYILRLPQIKDFLNNNLYRGIGISSYKIDDLLKIEIPLTSLEKQENFLERIAEKESKILQLQEKQENMNKLINDIFVKNFNYDYDEFNKLKSIKVLSRKFLDFGNNIDLRFSSKFHREAGRFIYKELKTEKYCNLKDIIKIPMITGQGISPKEYDENGEHGYVSMADIKTWYIDEENIKRVSNNYSDKHRFKKIKGVKEIQPTTIRKGDILLMRSGEGGIGKTAIVTNDLKAIFCDFIIRIRVDEDKYNPFFVYYYTRTEYFQYLVEINKKGLGNNTNIFPNILNYFPIPDISLEEQQKIIDEVEEKINEQKEIENLISKEQSDIEKILLEIL